MREDRIDVNGKQSLRPFATFAPLRLFAGKPVLSFSRSVEPSGRDFPQRRKGAKFRKGEEKSSMEFKPAPIKPIIALEDLEKLDIRVGTIVSVDDVAGSDKTTEADRKLR